MNSTITNTAELFDDATFTTLLDSAQATFDVLQDGTITMTKTTNKTGEYYLPGEAITFTISITNNGTAAINNATFRDVIDALVVPVNGTDFVVTTTSGTVTSAATPVVIDNIDIAAGETVVITITGEIAQ